MLNTASAQVPEPIRVVVAGPNGRMGRAMMEGLPQQSGLHVVGGLSRKDDDEAIAAVLAAADVIVDFTHPATSPALLERALDAGVRPVIGTSGLAEEVLELVDGKAREQGIGAVWAPHFRLAAVLMIRFAGIAARYLDHVEIIEAHHSTKADAPSGVARTMARMMRDVRGSDFVDPTVEKETLDGVRGGVHGGVRVHSIRVPDIVGWHEVMFSGDQEQLTIRHHETGRESYVPAVAAAVQKTMAPGVIGLVRGYDAVIGLAD
ncbi:4-hydroxy-tetrahydrodipicolinate reductase [Kribbella shirazensis]|uniref:4-hydroxy-tetrahydrodipicolinate reductase n=1 Tax=Kribbella shirazensis TaxID=1105143 RepID=A0A7X5VII1_9ACTN|nr:4-hydroxy-tetrahydrodipicolinate reductase [Kribbella shirazensis]NIK61441.1 4-hydroxy-tetrahydrodipicolinate reductase [Kribbella shirazensis]